jgi:hypothetical protein
VGVSGLRNAVPVFRRLWQPIALDDRNAFKVLGEHPRCEKAGHAGAQNHRVTGTGSRVG